MNPLLLAELPNTGNLILICIVVGIAALVGIGFILSFSRKLVSNVATIVKNEIATQREATPVQVQSPLSIQAHVGFTPLDKHNELRDQFATLADQRRTDVAGLHKKIENGLQNIREEIAAEFKDLRATQATAREEIAVLKSETNTQTRQLSGLDLKMDQVLMRLPRP